VTEVESTAAPPVLSLTVLGWNNVELTKACVGSLRRNTDVDYELIIVDNGSTDGSAQFATEAADRSVLNETNLGFAAGMNTGLQVATGKYVAFINNDTTFPAEWASRIIETFKTHPNAGIVAPAVTAAGNLVTVRNTPGDQRIVLTPFGELPSGVVYVMPTQLIRDLGSWNEDFKTASAEDLDLAFTVWAHGFDVVVDERVLVDHQSQATVTKLENRKTLYKENLEQFLTRWETKPLGTTPWAGSLDRAMFLSNQERAQTAIIWIRRMLEAREEARRVASVKSQASPERRRWWIIRARS
jgi:O-antigen biosynthesis protein